MNSSAPHPDTSAPETTLTAQLLPLVQDLARHRPASYWTDFLLSIGAFWGAWIALALRGAVADAWTVAGFSVAVFALYRASCFMHEIVHLPRRALPGFRWCWDLLCGIPMLLPSYFYRSHIDHHTTSTYGTQLDPEYLPLLHRSKASMALLLAGTVAAPLTLWTRFAVVAPLAWCVPAVRRLTDTRLSSVTLHPHYRADAVRPLQPQTSWRIAEVLATAWAWGATALVISKTVGLWWPASFLAVVLCVLCINMLRTAFTHHYAHSGARLTHAQQIADSVTWSTGGWLVELFAPLGLRYHALHHLFPYLPYHALAKAHARLIAAGAVAAPYQATDARTAARSAAPRRPQTSLTP